MTDIQLYVTINGVKYRVRVDLSLAVDVTLERVPPPPGPVASVDFLISPPQLRDR